MVLQLARIQIDPSSRYTSFGRAQMDLQQTVPAPRGEILDANGRILAISVPADAVISDPDQVRNAALAARELAGPLGQSAASIQSILEEHTGFAYLAQQLSPKAAEKVVAVATRDNIPGITLASQPVRVLPNGSLASGLLGTVDPDGRGISGLEKVYQPVLAGRDGQESLQVGANGVPLPGSEIITKPAKPGTSVELTLDLRLQYDLERALATEILASNARSGMGILTDPRTGAILAVASLVNTSPTAGQTLSPTQQVAYAQAAAATSDPLAGQIEESPVATPFTEVYEPGSVMKVVTFSGALTDGLINPNTSFLVPDQEMIGNYLFHDAEYHPTEYLTATQILAQSSNIGTIGIARLLGEAGLEEWLNRFGFGQLTAVNYPYQSAGILDNRWNASAIGSVPIGQDTGVTLAQLADAYDAVANGGVMEPSHLVKAEILPSGRIEKPSLPAARRVLPSNIDRELTYMFEHVITSGGTAPGAAIPGYLVAGKTGTANIPSSTQSGYVPGAYWATFVGFAPANAPAVVGAIALDRPTPIYGGSVAAPVFAQVVRDALEMDQIPPSGLKQPGSSGATS
jgi:cell division protein FtsI/penicillin-binding protein 2